uniref:Uncharacterized protein n=1 Tax=Physcomitrium patens TaxID=3218 RepID=A0A2K1L0L6_PHYPA|nr:hypothetical protein PHYPA_002353 [Physcomitrium patens]
MARCKHNSSLTWLLSRRKQLGAYESAEACLSQIAISLESNSRVSACCATQTFKT